MPKLTEANRLYLYQLFLREVGVGRQTALARIEEVLAADELDAQGLGFDDTRSLLEALSDFVRLTVFKRGRVYATLADQPGWNLALQAADEPAEKKPAAGGKRSWKKKKAKALRPAKPRMRRVEEPVPEEKPARQEEPSIEEAPVRQEQPAPQESIATADAANSSTETVESAAVPAMADTVPGDELSTETDDATDAQTNSPARTEDAHIVSGNAAVEATDVQQSHTGTNDVPDLAASEEADANNIFYYHANEDGQDVDPVSQHQEAPQPPVPDSEEAPLPPTTDDKGASQPAPVAVEPHLTAGIHFTVTYNPYEDEDSDDGTPDAAATSEPRPVADAPTPTVPESPGSVPSDSPDGDATTRAEDAVHDRIDAQRRLPHDFAADVLCDNEQLARLYELLPLNVEPIAVLDEDWRVARSTNGFRKEGATVAFPIRYLDAAAGRPLTVVIRRIGRTASGKAWRLERVEAGDAGRDVGFEGLPVAADSSWPELARFAHLGDEQDLLQQLARLAQPEPWGPDLMGLRTYLALTFRRARREEALDVDEGQRRLTFDTGLLDLHGRPIHMLFCAAEGDLPWAFTGFDV